jgi:Ca2+-transporting ATPase
MKFASLIERNLVCVNLHETDSEDVIREMVGKITAHKKNITANLIIEKLLEREKLTTTGIGNGVAIPHARIDSVKEMLFFCGVSKAGVAFNSLDNKPVHLFFLFITPTSETASHLKILSRISLITKNNELVKRLIESKTDQELYETLVLQRTEKENYISLSTEQIFQELVTNTDGLTKEDAARRLQEYGFNRLKKARGTPLLKKFLDNFTNTLALLMWAGSGLAFFIGMNQIGSAIIFVIIINALFSFWQEFKAEKAIEALKNLIPYFSRVIRDGKELKISSTEVVPGDIIVFDEGDNIPADARLLSAHELRVDNSVFSGESRPGYKTSDMLILTQGYIWTEMPNLVFAGTSVVSGNGSAVIIATGMSTEIGKIASLTQSVKDELSPLQKEINRLTKIIAFVAVGLGVLFLAAGIKFAKLSITASALFAVGIILGNVPEGLLPTVTLALAVAVQRMAKKHVLIKKLSSVETLGSTDVICTDKTGTLTTNQISVLKVWINNRIVNISGTSYEPKGNFTDQNGSTIESGFFKNTAFSIFAKNCILCSTAKLFNPTNEHPQWNISGDPTEGSLLVFAEKAGFDIEKERTLAPLLKRFPFESVRKRMSSLHSDHEGVIRAFVKGSPKEILSLSKQIQIEDRNVPLTITTREVINSAIDGFAIEGLRILALAYKNIDSSESIKTMTNAEAESDLIFLGLAAMYDPPRPEVLGAILKCKEAGIRVVMITGDYEITAKSIARQVGIVSSEKAQVMTGVTLSGMSDETLKESLKGEVVFARVNPEHKFRIVKAFKELGNTVAVTGDGVNDAPALKIADIGIAMGIRGTDVAKEAADMVLSDDNFASIVAGIEEGRAVFDNIRKFITYIFAHLVPEVVPFGVYAFFKTPVPITPLQILAIDLGTETLPALALGTEKPDTGIMQMPPRPKTKRLVDCGVLLRGYAYLGILNAIFVMIAYFWVLYRGGWRPGIRLETNDLTFTNQLHLEAMTIVFLGIVIMQIANVFTVRSETKSIFEIGFFSNKLIIAGIIFELIFAVVLIHVPFFQKIFNTTDIGIKDYMALFFFMIIIFFVEEGRKFFIRRSHRNKKSSPISSK